MSKVSYLLTENSHVPRNYHRFCFLHLDRFFDVPPIWLDGCTVGAYYDHRWLFLVDHLWLRKSYSYARLRRRSDLRLLLSSPRDDIGSFGQWVTIYFYRPRPIHQETKATYRQKRIVATNPDISSYFGFPVS